MDIQSLIEATTSWMATSQGQMYLTIAAGTILSGAASAYYEIKRSKTMPLAFSERAQMLKESNFSGKQIGPLANFLATTNDLCMLVFEAYNDSNANGTKGAFSKELAKRNTRTLNGEGLRELVESSQKYARELSSELKEHFAVNDSLVSIIDQLDKSWTESHTDHYRTEMYWDTEISTDSKGHTTSNQVLKSRQVYDHTTHKYRYHAEHGIKAAELSRELHNRQPTLAWHEAITPAKKVSEAGKALIKKSRGKKEKDITDEECLAISKTWVEGTQRDEELAGVPGQYDSLKAASQAWNEAKETPKEYYCYDTTSTSDSGPQQYRVAKHNRNTAFGLWNSINNSRQNIALVLDKVPKIQLAMHALAQDAMPTLEGYVTSEDKNREKEFKELKKQVLEDTKEVYGSIFTEGIDLDRVKEWRIGLFATAGGLLTFGGWKLVEYLTQTPGAVPGMLERF